MPGGFAGHKPRVISATSARWPLRGWRQGAWRHHRQSAVHGLGIGVHFHLVAHGLQARNAALERGLVADGASGRVDVDVLGAVVVFAVRRVVVVGQSVQARQRPAP